MFKWSMQANKKGSILAKKHPFIYCPAAKHQNAANLALQRYKKNQWTFLWHHKGADFSSRNNFANLGSLQKFSCL